MVTDLQLDYKEICEKYPKSVERIKEWFKNHDLIKRNFKDMDLDLEDDETLSMTVGLVIQFDPRKLYDVFDSLGIIISISDYSGVFSYVNNKQMYSANKNTRVEAEIAAFIDAFTELEGQLS